MDLIEKLKDASESGDTNVLYTLIGEDPYILEHFNAVPFVETPLHTAAIHGHVNFVREIMRLKPWFAKKPNQQVLYPIHLAAMEGQIHVVRALLTFERKLARLQGREGKTPLHYAAARGDLLLLDSILSASPQSMRDVTDRNETALHIALKSRNFEAFYFLLRELRTACHQGAGEDQRTVLNIKDEEGNTVVHIAVSLSQPQVVKQLVRVGAELNKENAMGLTPIDMPPEVDGVNTEIIRKILTKAGAVSASKVLKSSDHLVLTSILPLWTRITIDFLRQKNGISMETRSSLLVLSVLIATVMYEAAVDPPSKNNDNNISLVMNITLNSSSTVNDTIHYFAETINNSNYDSNDHLFWICNVWGLSSSLVTIIFLLPGKYLLSIMIVPLYSFILCYAATTVINGPSLLEMPQVLLSLPLFYVILAILWK